MLPYEGAWLQPKTKMKLDGHVHEDKLGEESILVSFIVVTEFGSKSFIYVNILLGGVSWV